MPISLSEYARRPVLPRPISTSLNFLSPSLASGARRGAAFPRRSFLAPQSRRRRAPLARSGELLGLERCQFPGRRGRGGSARPPVAYLLGDRGGPERARDGQRDQG